MDAASVTVAAAASAAEVPRRLYESGFEGWDISQACYVTDYLIMAVGISCGLLAYDKVRRQGALSGVWGLMGQFATFSLLQGVGSGFRGVSHHLLDTYMTDGNVMGRRWGAPHSEWLFAWLMALVVLPLASSACLGTSLAYGEFGVGWIKVVKGLGVVVTILEVGLCLTNQIDQSGALSVYWGILTSILACFAVFRRGQAVGLCWIFLGNALRVAGYVVLVSAPAGCKSAHTFRADCPYPVEFNHNAVFHSLIAASLLATYFGVNAKYTKDTEVAYWEGLQFTQKQQQEMGKTRMCGLAW